MTCPVEQLYRILDVYPEARRRNVVGAEFLGLHLEGPYLAMDQRGAQDARISQPLPEGIFGDPGTLPGDQAMECSPRIGGGA